MNTHATPVAQYLVSTLYCLLAKKQSIILSVTEYFPNVLISEIISLRLSWKLLGDSLLPKSTFNAVPGVKRLAVTDSVDLELAVHAAFLALHAVHYLGDVVEIVDELLLD